MNADERSQLVAAYISHHTRRHVWGQDMVLREELGEQNFWAFEKMAELAQNSPELCLDLILQILRTPHEDSVAEVLAAGPLEELLVHHGSEIIARLEKAAMEDASFRHLLGGVWETGIDKSVWARVDACRGERW